MLWKGKLQVYQKWLAFLKFGYLKKLYFYVTPRGWNNWKRSKLVFQFMKGFYLMQQHSIIGHSEGDKIFRHIKMLFYWLRMRKNMRLGIVFCDLCQKTKKFSVCNDLLATLPTFRVGVTQLWVILDSYL